MIATPRPEPPADDRPPAGAWTAVVVVLACALVLAALAAVRVQNPRYPLDLDAALRGVRATAAATLPAALRVWALAAVAVGAVGYWLRRRHGALSVGEAAAGAATLLWAGTYVALLALGPVGLYRPTVLRALVVAVVLAALVTARRGSAQPAAATSVVPPPAARRRARAGAWIAALAAALALGPLLILELASPVSPFMDVLPYVASAQKIVTFRFYDPFGNDAAGLWAASRQLAGCDALFSSVALVAGVPGNLAITALIVPFAILQIAALYLLGRALAGGLAGGMAALFLLETFVWRRTPDARGTALAFFLVAIGLAFLVGRRRAGLRAALGGLALGVAVTVNPLIGACGMQVAAATVVVAWLDLGLPLVAPVVALAGGSVFALPQVAVGTGTRVPVLLLPVALVAGAALLLAAARLATRARDRRAARGGGRAWPFARAAVIAALPLTVLDLHARHASTFFPDDWFGYGLLLLLGVAGLGAALVAVWRRPASVPAAAVPALAVWVAMLDYRLADPQRYVGTLAMRSLASEVTTKMAYYWTPYWAALAAGVFFAMLARRWGRAPAVVLALLLVVYPLRQAPEMLDYDTAELPVADTWAFNLANAARGYFAGYPDRRWVLDAEWRKVAGVLLDEVAAGRLRYDTHVVEVAPSTNAVEAALGTGVSIDLVTPQYDPNSIWNVGSRIRGPASLSATMAARPPYVLLRDTPAGLLPELGAYEPLYVTPRTALYRLRSARAEPSSPAAPAAESDATM